MLRKVLSATKSTICPKQLPYFSELSNIWWDADGTMKPLHAMNNLRIPWIRNRLCDIGVIKDNGKSTPLDGLTILDVGCGGGIASEPLTLLGGKVTGIDCNREMLNIAKLRAQESKLYNLRYIKSTVEEHVVENREKYDVVVASETIEHVNEQDLFVKCCVECLKPGGSIFFTTNSKSRLSKFLFITLVEDILKLIPKGTHEYDMFIDVEDLKKLLKKENCETLFTSGMVYNPLSSRWMFIKNHYILHYVLHGVKLRQ